MSTSLLHPQLLLLNFQTMHSSTSVSTTVQLRQNLSITMYSALIINVINNCTISCTTTDPLIIADLFLKLSRSHIMKNSIKTTHTLKAEVKATMKMRAVITLRRFYLKLTLQFNLRTMTCRVKVMIFLYYKTPIKKSITTNYSFSTAVRSNLKIMKR